MAKPSTRRQFRDYCLRALGHGAHKVEITPDQCEDRIDEALDFWQQHHFEGTEKVFYKHQITSTDRTNGYFTLPETIVGVYRVLNFGTSQGLSPLTNIQYQIRLNDFFNFIDQSIVPYYMAMRRIAELDEWLGDLPTFEYTRHGNRLWLHIDWDKFTTTEYIVVEAQQIIDTGDIWSDHWFQRYVVALFKRQWGENLKKYGGVQILNGMTFDGQKIYDEGVAQIAEIELEVKEQLQPPMGFFIG